MKVPDGWKEVKLGNIMTFKNGLNFSQDIDGIEVNFLGVGNFKDKNKISSLAEIDSIKLANIPNDDYLLHRNDLVFVRSNGSKDLVGRCVIINRDFEKLTYSGFCIRGRITNNDILPQYISALIEKGILKDKLKSENRGTNISNLNQDILNDLVILVPTLAEQKAIAETLSVWDNMIEKMEQLIAKKEECYIYELSSIFSSSENQKLLNSFAHEVSIRNSSETVTQVLSVTNKNGFVLPEDQFDRKVASDDLSNYKIIKKGQFAYNPSRINVGSIARLNDWQEAVLSPMYTVFEIDKDIINSDYFVHWLHSNSAHQKIKQCAQGGVREIVNFDDFSKVSLPIPDRNRQNKLAELLSGMQNEIDLLKQLVAQYKLQKQGLMQKLLTGQWRIK